MQKKLSNSSQITNRAVRNATHKDISLIRHLALAVWPQTYSSILTTEQINYMLEYLYSEKSLERQMKDRHKFLILYDETIPVGFASYSEMRESVFKLHKLYLLPQQQGKGAGRFLINYIIETILQQEALALRLNVNRHNNAKSFYEKLGFTVIKEENVDIGKGYFMNDYVMEKYLR